MSTAWTWAGSLPNVGLTTVPIKGIAIKCILLHITVHVLKKLAGIPAVRCMSLTKRQRSDGRMNYDDDCDSWYSGLSYSCMLHFVQRWRPWPGTSPTQLMSSMNAPVVILSPIAQKCSKQLTPVFVTNILSYWKYQVNRRYSMILRPVAWTSL